MRISYINGRRIRRALIAASERLSEKAASLDAINVFPVPDGDTGTNMAATLRGMAFGLRGSSLDLGLAATVRVAADSALTGAKGNSGAILAQYFQGLAEELEHEARITARAFALAAGKAVEKLYLSLSKPREGTMLSVLRDWAEAARIHAAKTNDFIHVLFAALGEARASLQRTKDSLPELKKAGVVDAGAQGVVHMLEGIMAYIARGRIRDIDGAVEEPAESGLPLSEAQSLAAMEGDPSPRYCVECLIAGEGLQIAPLRERLEALGDSIVVAGSSSRLRVHVHTDDPPAAFELIESCGKAMERKVDDMLLQVVMARSPRRPTAILVDSACDIPDDERLALGVERVAVSVSFMGRDYLDRESLRAGAFHGLLASHPEAQAATSQPSAQAYARKYTFLLGRADEVVYLGLSGILSGTLEAGTRAARALPETDSRRVRALDSRNLSIGMALIARHAARAAAQGASANEVEALVHSIRERVRILIAVPELSSLMRSGRLKGVKALAARVLGLRPIITTDLAGRAVAYGLYPGAIGEVSALSKAADRDLGRGVRSELIIGHVARPDGAEALRAALDPSHGNGPPSTIVEVGPALAVHGGLGALAVAYLLPEGRTIGC